MMQQRNNNKEQNFYYLGLVQDVYSGRSRMLMTAEGCGDCGDWLRTAAPELDRDKDEWLG